MKFSHRFSTKSGTDSVKYGQQSIYDQSADFHENHACSTTFCENSYNKFN